MDHLIEEAGNLKIRDKYKNAKETNENMYYMGTGDVPTFYYTSPFERNTIAGWTKRDKLYLYLAIRLGNSKNLRHIQESIPKKTLKDIEDTIAYFTREVKKNIEWTKKQAKIRKVKTKPLIPLASWAKVLTDNYSYDELETELVSALRLIADLDKIPPPILSDQIDFREIYHLLGDAMEGKSIPESDTITKVLNSCTLEVALLSKQFINVNTFKNITSTINFNDKSTKIFPRLTKDCEVTIIRQLVAQLKYNPLGIPEDNLLPMQNEPGTNPKATE